MFKEQPGPQERGLGYGIIDVCMLMYNKCENVGSHQLFISKLQTQPKHSNPNLGHLVYYCKAYCWSKWSVCAMCYRTIVATINAVTTLRLSPPPPLSLHVFIFLQEGIYLWFWILVRAECMHYALPNDSCHYLQSLSLSFTSSLSPCVYFSPRRILPMFLNFGPNGVHALCAAEW